MPSHVVSDVAYYPDINEFAERRTLHILVNRWNIGNMRNKGFADSLISCGQKRKM